MEKFSHSAHKTRVYRIWHKMRSRCNNPESPGYQYYGARGITVCDRWDYSFEYFLEDMGEPPEGYTLDRIDVNKGYSKENCRWASPKQQQNNRRCNVLVTIDGETHTASEWAEIKGLNPGTVRERLRRGWTPEEALLPKLKSRHDRPKIRELGILQEPGERYGKAIDYETGKTGEQMSKLTRALEVIRNECDEHFMCDECPLGYKRNDGDYWCIIDEWCTSKVLRPRNWPIDEVLKGKGEGGGANGAEGSNAD